MVLWCATNPAHTTRDPYVPLAARQRHRASSRPYEGSVVVGGKGGRASSTRPELHDRHRRALAAAGDKFLVGSKYQWLYSAENLPARHQDRFAVLRAGDLRTARAGAIKESLRHVWSHQRRGWAAKHFNHWYFWATYCRLKPVIDAAKTLKRHQAWLLSCLAHQITNAGGEGLNSAAGCVSPTRYGCPATASSSMPTARPTCATSTRRRNARPELYEGRG